MMRTQEADVVFLDDVWKEKRCFKAVFSFSTIKLAFKFMSFLFSLLEYIIKRLRFCNFFNRKMYTLRPNTIKGGTLYLLS